MKSPMMLVQPWNPRTEGYALLVPGQDTYSTLALIEAAYAVLDAQGMPHGMQHLPVVGMGTAYGVVPAGVN